MPVRPASHISFDRPPSPQPTSRKVCPPYFFSASRNASCVQKVPGGSIFTNFIFVLTREAPAGGGAHWRYSRASDHGSKNYRAIPMSWSVYSHNRSVQIEDSAQAA